MVHRSNASTLRHMFGPGPLNQKNNRHPQKMKLSPNFTLAELTATDHPNLQTQPTVEQVINLVYLCAAVLQPLRDLYGQPIIVTSGFRSQALNTKIGGVNNSYHLQGLAADLRVKSESEAFALFCLLKNIPAVDLCLFEKQGTARWLHVQTVLNRQPRREFNYNYNV